MKLVAALIGALIGVYFAEVDKAVLGFGAGAAIGYLLAAVMGLQRRVDALEQLQLRLPVAAPSPPRRQPAPPAQPVEPAAPTAAGPAPASAAAASAAARPLAEAAGWATERRAEPRASREPALPPAARTFEPSAVDKALAAARRWLTTGNVPVKIGVVVSFFGVAFLLKYAVDRRLLVFPIELRLLAVAAAAIALLVIGWRLRERARVYALSLQGGGIGILYLTIFAALRLYALIPPAFAFALLFVLVIASGALAVLQNARGLATLGAAGGFLAPVLISTGAGNHVALFSYYLLLNLMIVGVAWFRPWRELNLLGFAFTFVIGGLWGYRNYTPDMLGTTMPFVIVYFLFYQLAAILFALRQPPNLRGVVDGTLVFGTPVLTFAMQAVLLRDTEYGLAFTALGAGLFYAVAATLLQRSRPGPLRLLIESFVAMAVAFGTLAIPLALDARWTAAAWALEGAALVWIGRRQDHWLARAAGVLLVLGAGLAFMDHGWRSGLGPPILNGNLLGGGLIALAGFFTTRQLEQTSGRYAAVETWVARGVFLVSACWWLGTGAAEIHDRLPSRFEPAAVVLLVAASGGLLTIIADRLGWALARVAAFASLPLLAFGACGIAIDGSHPSADLGWAAWVLAVAGQFWMLRRNERALAGLQGVAHTLLVALATVLVMWEIHWQLRTGGYSDVWASTLASAVPGGVLLAVLRLGSRPGWPVGVHRRSYAFWAGGLLFALQWLLVAYLNLATDGAMAPLPYVPLVNPVDLGSAFALLCALQWLLALAAVEGWLATPVRQSCLIALGAAAFVVSTLALLRAVHHLGGVPWQPQALSTSVLVQAALSVYWGVLGFAAMVLGARRSRRWLWLTGAVLMGIVVLKLFAVDLGNTGTVARIVSFIATGVLLLVVGYLAPAPPRQAESNHG